ncbi:hypothetical protein KAI87_09305 [Myxococcota bacterium]|nr:hypothetical protein [Myxococcota bacterium]
MMGMGNALRDEIHMLVDDMPDDQLELARESLRDMSHDPFADMDPEERERLHQMLAQSRRDFVEGKGMPARDFLQELRSKQ